MIMVITMYVKLFTSLYKGTLRGRPDEILVFTNMLANADQCGVVDIHFKSISEEIGISIERVKVAIKNLELPDNESRSLEEEGKRLIRLDYHREWGWKIVNYIKYRSIRNEEDRREQNRASQERWRNKNKPPPVSIVSIVSQDKPPSATVSPDKPMQKQKQKKNISSEISKNPSSLSSVPEDDGSFSKFWEAYPRKDAKKKSESAWKTKKIHKHLPAILQDIKRRMNSGDWVDKKYIPIATTYLNGERWKDGGEEKPEYSPYDNII